MPEWYKRNVAETITTLDSSIESGLAAEVVARRQAESGPNELVQSPGRSIGRILWQQMSGPMVVLLLAAFGVSLLLAEFVDAVAILAIVILNAGLGFYQDLRAEKAMASLKSLAAPSVRVRRAGRVAEIPARDLVPGDIILLETGNRVPADGRVLLSAGLEMEEALLTGESDSVIKDPATLTGDHVPLGDMRNMVFMGTVVRAGRGEAVVSETGMATQLGRISGMLQSISTERTPLQRKLSTLAIWLSFVAIGCVGIVVVLGVLQGASLSEVFMTGLSLSVAIVPEGLPAVATVTLALGSMRMLRRQALIRQLPAVETLGSITAICADKTGTITENVMTLDEIRTLAGHGRLAHAHRRPAGSDQTDVLSQDSLAKQSDLSLLLLCGALCNDAAQSDTAGESSVVGDPTECALIVAAAQFGDTKSHLDALFSRVAEAAFDSTRKRMTTVHEPSDGAVGDSVLATGAAHFLDTQAGDRCYAFTKGAVVSVLEVCVSYIDRDTVKPLLEVDRKRIESLHDTMAAEGRRVLALAFRSLNKPKDGSPRDFECEMTFIGLAGLLDPPRPEVSEAVSRCRAAGIRPIMITGDHRLTAEHVGADVGIGSAESALTADVLEQASDDELKRLVQLTSIYARVSPEHKLRIVAALKDAGEVVCMTGDGANDAPALKEADIGVAMGMTGTDVARDAADMILLDDNFATIVNAVEEGRTIYDNIRKFLRYTMTSNAGEVGVMAIAPFLGMPLPLLPLQILWINLVTDGLPGLALALEPPEQDVMRRPPRSPNAPILDIAMAREILWIGGLMSAVTVGAGYWYWRDAPSAEYDASWGTVVFTVLTLSQMGNALATRSNRESLFTLGLFSNWPMLLAVLLTLGLQLAVIYLPPLQVIFDTKALSARDLGICLALSTVVFFSVEGYKWLKRSVRPVNR